MTREDVLKMFPDATDEQVTNLLNRNNSEVAKEKEKVEKYKADMDKYKDLEKEKADLQAKVDEIEQGKLTEVEKITKDYEKANSRIAELEKSIAIRDQKSTIAEKFKVTAEQVNQIVKEDGSLDYDILGQIISEKESAAALAKEQEIANAAANPNGTSGSNGNDESVAVNIAKASAKRAASANEKILDSYRR